MVINGQICPRWTDSAWLAKRYSIFQVEWIPHSAIYQSNVGSSSWTTVTASCCAHKSAQKKCRGAKRAAILFHTRQRENTLATTVHMYLNILRTQSSRVGEEGGGRALLWLALKNCHGIIPSFAKAQGVRRKNLTKTPRTTIKHFC